MNAACPLGFLGGGAGFGEILLVFAVVLVLFGPRKLPEFARTLGRILEELRRASQDFRYQVMRLDQDPPPPFRSRTVDVETTEGVAGPDGDAARAAGEHAGNPEDKAEAPVDPPAGGG